MEYDVRRWRKDSKQFLKDCEEASKGAQNRETVSDHVLEDVPGNKGKINIDFGESRKLYLTSDSMVLEKGTVTLLEGKNTSSGKYPVMGDVKDALIKLMIFRSSDFEFEGEELEKKLVCYLTGNQNDVEDEFRNNCKSLIDECSANDIELVLNRRIIK